MSEELNIDELLNGFIDGQLSARQTTEIQRLIAHDTKIAERLAELKKCRLLVSSLPHEKAPPQTARQIKASLERRALLEDRQADYDQLAGAKNLLLRKVLTAAAMVGLVAVLAAVVYNIVAPQAKPQKIVVSSDWTAPPDLLESPKPASVKTASIEEKSQKPDTYLKDSFNVFSATLEIKTSDLVAVDAFVKRVIADNGLMQYTGPADSFDKNIYVIACSRQTLDSILMDLQNVWQRLHSKKLFVESGYAEPVIVIDQVSLGQIAEIAGQNTTEQRLNTAKDFAFLNNITELLPGRELLAAVDDNKTDLINIPKPVLTSNQKRSAETVHKEKLDPDVYLTIVITDSASKIQ